jgi:hypothetical protein
VGVSNRSRDEVFSLLRLQEGDFPTGLFELALGLLQLLLDKPEVLLGILGTLFPAIPAVREIAVADLRFFESAIALVGLGLPVVPALHQFGDDWTLASRQHKNQGISAISALAARTTNLGCVA